MSNRYARVCLDEASAYAKERVTFDKRLADHQASRLGFDLCPSPPLFYIKATHVCPLACECLRSNRRTGTQCSLPCAGATVSCGAICATPECPCLRQVIRHKIADMAMRVEATHALVEQCAYQMSRGVADRALGGRIALLKVRHAPLFITRCVRTVSNGNQRSNLGVSAGPSHTHLRVLCA